MSDVENPCENDYFVDEINTDRSILKMLIYVRDEAKIRKKSTLAYCLDVAILSVLEDIENPSEYRDLLEANDNSVSSIFN